MRYSQQRLSIAALILLTALCLGVGASPARLNAAGVAGAPVDGRGQQAETAGAAATIGASFFQRADLLYGSSFGSWTMQDGRYDGQYMLNYKNSCPSCVQLALNAQIPVFGWAVPDTFTDQTDPAGRQGSLTADQFSNVVDGIHNTLSATPFLKLQPNDDTSAFCPENWGISNLLRMNEEVISTAGSRVQLYEIASEPELACGYSPSAAGNKVAQYWINMVPALKEYARSLGLTIYIGGPATTTTHISNHADTTDLQMIHDFLQGIRDEYENPASRYYHDPDLIPDFVSFHTYGIEYVNMVGGDSTPLDAIPYYGRFIDSVQADIATLWGDVASNMKVVVSEWNIGAESYTFPEPLTATFYAEYLAMLRQHNIFMALQFLSASSGNGMDMITETGQDTPYFDAFQEQSLGDPLAIRSRLILANPNLAPDTAGP